MSHPDLTPRRRDKQARPQQLLDAALTLFVEKGFAATRTEEVAKLAGLSKGTLYLYFASKEELLKAVIAEHLSSRVAKAARLAAGHAGSATELLGGLVPSWCELYDSPAAGVFKLIITEVRNFPDIGEFYVRNVIEPGHQLVGTILARGIASGEFRRVDVESAVHSLLLPMVMLCTHKHALGACTQHTIDAPRFIADHVDLVVRGLLRAPAPATRKRAATRKP